jgi:hypothetical protein
LVSKDETKLIINQHYSNVDSELLLLDLVDRRLVSLTKPLSGDKPTRWIALRWLNRAQTKMLVKTVPFCLMIVDIVRITRVSL